MPFTETQKRQAIVAALRDGERSGLEHQVAHLLRTTGVQVRLFAALYEFDGSVR